MEVYCGKRRMIRIDQQTGAYVPLDAYTWCVKRDTGSWWIFDDEGEDGWQYIRNGFAAQVFLLGVENLRQSSPLELLVRTGQTIGDIPMTKWDKVKAFFLRMWVWLKRLGRK